MSYSWLVVLNQDCDLDLDYHARRGTSPRSGASPVRGDKALHSVQLCRAFPEDDLLAGIYLLPLVELNKWSKPDRDAILANRHERFHTLQPEPPRVTESLIVDFKLVVSVSPEYLERWIRYHPLSRVGVLNPPFRDRLTQRFINYYSRIAEPES